MNQQSRRDGSARVGSSGTGGEAAGCEGKVQRVSLDVALAASRRGRTRSAVGDVGDRPECLCSRRNRADDLGTPTNSRAAGSVSVRDRTDQPIRSTPMGPQHEYPAPGYRPATTVPWDLGALYRTNRAYSVDPAVPGCAHGH